LTKTPKTLRKFLAIRKGREKVQRAIRRRRVKIFLILPNEANDCKEPFSIRGEFCSVSFGLDSNGGGEKRDAKKSSVDDSCGGGEIAI
jgi:hypothetical protein